MASRSTSRQCVARRFVYTQRGYVEREAVWHAVAVRVVGRSHRNENENETQDRTEHSTRRNVLNRRFGFGVRAFAPNITKCKVTSLRAEAFERQRRMPAKSILALEGEAIAVQIFYILL